MKRFQRVLTYVVLAFLLVGGGLALIEMFSFPPDDDLREAAVYSCPRHPLYVFDQPGKCPVCRIDLVKKQTADAPSSAGTGPGQQRSVYSCPMHPDFIADKPRSCPICGMDLVRKQIARVAVVKEPGVYIPKEKQQLIGVTTEKVAKRNLSLVIRAPARVVLDKELYLAQIAYSGPDVSDGEGWTETFKKLRTLGISPEEVYALNNTCLAQKFYFETPKANSNTDPRVEVKNELYQKLLTLGMSPEDVYALNNNSQVDDSLVSFGFGNNVWVYAAINKDDMPLVKPGQPVELMPLGLVGEKILGTVAGVSQTVDPESRMGRVRIRVKDVPPTKIWSWEERRLRLGMILAAVFTHDLGEKLSIPAEAVMDTGLQKIVYVVKDDRFTRREVNLGPRVGDYYEVYGGLEENEVVVISGNFLVDSESHLQGVR